ncbi:MAG: polysaccharide biosynthesis C-terminal domain-containing protein, partial [Clostridia bacterium]|nr:polysaccharide biosynthesis C-terminal domain-containing protein [Clostridia bacterium]
FKAIVCLVISLVFGTVIFTNGGFLLGLYLRGEGSPASAAASGEIALRYIKIMFIGIIPYALAQCYGSTLRETGRPKVPMYAGVLAVVLNLSLNYVLIFGRLGFPRLGVTGAAIATVVSRFAELAYVAAGAHTGKKSELLKGVFSGFGVPLALAKKMIYTGAPLFLNELLWSTGIAFVNQCYSVRGLVVVAADNIVMAFFNVFSVVFFAVGIAIGIIVGQMLGAGETEEVMNTAVKMRALSVYTALGIGVLFALLSGVIPRLYNTTNEVRDLAKWMIIITAASMPVDAFAQASYFTLRSGGKVLITMIFDSFFVWAVSVPFAFIVSRYTDLPILPFYALSLSLNVLKCVLGYFYVKKGSWIKNLVGKAE